MSKREVIAEGAAQWRPRSGQRVAVLVPCFNEETAIGKVIADFRAALPEATIYVYDNNSSDETIGVARRAGAIVRSEALQGKGNVVRRMFADIEADVYVMSDGDATYDASRVDELIQWPQTRRRRDRLLVPIRISSAEKTKDRAHATGCYPERASIRSPTAA